MSPVPLHLVTFFLFTVLLALIGFALTVRWQKAALGLSLLWMVFQSAIALSGFYLQTKTIPPHFFLAPSPAFLLIAVVFLTRRGRGFVDSMSLKWSVLLHSVRILVEVTLYWLFLYKQVPAQLTFEGGNVDILIGVTAPLVFCFRPLWGPLWSSHIWPSSESFWFLGRVLASCRRIPEMECLERAQAPYLLRFMSSHGTT